MTKAHILFVDDELVTGQIAPNGNYMWYYVQALKDAGYDLVEANTSDEAIQTLVADSPPIQLVILDMALPPGSDFTEAEMQRTKEGTRTGLVIANRIRRAQFDRPLIILTNHRRPDIKSAFDKDNYCRVLFKGDYTPNQVVEEVTQFLTG
jgi:CheY-like chemotaxis protein